MRNQKPTSCVLTSGYIRSCSSVYDCQNCICCAPSNAVKIMIAVNVWRCFRWDYYIVGIFAYVTRDFHVSSSQKCSTFDVILIKSCENVRLNLGDRQWDQEVFVKLFLFKWFQCDIFIQWDWVSHSRLLRMQLSDWINQVSVGTAKEKIPYFLKVTQHTVWL